MIQFKLHIPSLFRFSSWKVEDTIDVSENKVVRRRRECKREEVRE